MENTNEKKPDECCPPFNPEIWDGKIEEWSQKFFVRDRIFSLFYIPINFGSVMQRLDKLVTKNEANVPDQLCLCDHTTMWNIDVYLAVDKDLSDAEVVKLSGKYLFKVYEGSFSDTGKWNKQFSQYANEMNYKVKKRYMWYTTCPKCAKKYNKNYVVITGEIDLP